MKKSKQNNPTMDFTAMLETLKRIYPDELGTARMVLQEDGKVIFVNDNGQKISEARESSFCPFGHSEAKAKKFLEENNLLKDADITELSTKQKRLVLRAKEIVIKTPNGEFQISQSQSKKAKRKAGKGGTLKRFIKATGAKDISMLKKFFSKLKAEDLAQETTIEFQFISWFQDVDGTFKLSYLDKGKEKIVTEKRLKNIFSEPK